MNSEQEIEAAYKKMKKQRTPDLWAGIEAGIDAEDEDGELPKISGNPSFSRSSDNRKKRKITRKQIAAMSGAAAAVIVLLMSVSQFSNQRNFYKNDMDKIIVGTPTATPPEDNKKEEILQNTDSADESLKKGWQKEEVEKLEGQETVTAVPKNGEQTNQIESDRQKDSKTSPPKPTAVPEKSDEISQGSNNKGKTFTKKPTSTLVAVEEKADPQQSQIPVKITANPISISLLKVDDVSVESLEQITETQLPEKIRTELKIVLEHYDLCNFYGNQSGNVYVLDGKTWYLIIGFVL